MTLDADSSVRPLTVHAIGATCSLGRQQHPLPERVALILCDGERSSVPSKQHLRRLYDLTPAEAELVLLLARGLRLEEAACARGIRIGTARAQLKSVFGKTDTHRQAELIRLLAISSPLCADENRDAATS